MVGLPSGIAWVITGGDLPGPTWLHEQQLLDLEREVFLSLLGEKATQKQIAELLTRNQPKAAQMAEMGRIWSSREACTGLIPTPDAPAAIPVVHSREHLSESGASARLAAGNPMNGSIDPLAARFFDLSLDRPS